LYLLDVVLFYLFLNYVIELSLYFLVSNIPLPLHPILILLVQ
jgi:hypothetical protein